MIMLCVAGGSQQTVDGRMQHQIPPKEEPAMTKKVNGFLNGPVSTENNVSQAAEDDIETPA